LFLGEFECCRGVKEMKVWKVIRQSTLKSHSNGDDCGSDSFESSDEG
jgi:hypothetical protein